MSGYNTKWFVEFALPTIKRELSERSPALITLWLGANDAALPDGESAKQHVPLPTYSANLVKIVQSFRDRAPNANLLLITPPHVDDAVRQSFSPTNRAERTNAMAGEYAQACVEVGRKLDVNVLDVYSIFNSMEESERAECLDDGLHFSTKGNALVFRELQTKIHDAFPELEKSLENWQLPNFHIWFD
ncbi:hypothetical protein PHYBOEH_011738 [Phytophthora boehmeriae]|uniref:SGNH hydrolase-type esterase domain-containing protein n=1 Tax=Phytophthora boehmeriae TaxID=109152 RepID=A0A8T1WZ02_9STRA|nr:hypothetical protein PHYBOEH_011738 [Phytophthora boehmeriae]